MVLYRVYTRKIRIPYDDQWYMNIRINGTLNAAKVFAGSYADIRMFIDNYLEADSVGFDENGNVICVIEKELYQGV